MKELLEKIEQMITKESDPNYNNYCKEDVLDYLREIKQLAIAEQERIIKELEERGDEAWRKANTFRRMELKNTELIWLGYHLGIEYTISKIKRNE